MPSEEQRTSNSFIALTEQWLETWQRLNALGHQNPQGIALFWDPRLRSRWVGGPHSSDGQLHEISRVP